jgi:hypothetical protein
MRFLLGFFECGLFPGISFFLSGWYKVPKTPSPRHSVLAGKLAYQTLLLAAPGNEQEDQCVLCRRGPRRSFRWHSRM